jgi:hypothetical protein
LLHGALATGQYVAELNELMLDEEREEEEENEHGQLAVEPNEPNNDANSNSTQLYSWC